MLKEKFMDFANLLIVEEFNESIGWLEMFEGFLDKQRISPMKHTLNGKKNLPELLASHKKEDVFYLDEIGLF